MFSSKTRYPIEDLPKTGSQFPERVLQVGIVEESAT